MSASGFKPIKWDVLQPAYRAMPRLHASFPGSTLLNFILCFTGTASMAMERSLVPGGPPLAYRIDEVNLHLTRHPGKSALPIQRVSLSGTGSATTERDGKLVQISYTTRNLVALLNELYMIRFFELPSKYTTRYSIFLKDDGTVATGRSWKRSRINSRKIFMDESG